MIHDEGYNGWKNHGTWCVALWLANEEHTYRFWSDAARYLDADDVDDVDTLAERMRREVPTSGVVGDPVDWDEVDWRDVAASFLE